MWGLPSAAPDTLEVRVKTPPHSRAGSGVLHPLNTTHSPTSSGIPSTSTSNTSSVNGENHVDDVTQQKIKLLELTMELEQLKLQTQLQHQPSAGHRVQRQLPPPQQQQFSPAAVRQTTAPCNMTDGITDGGYYGSSSHGVSLTPSNIQQQQQMYSGYNSMTTTNTNDSYGNSHIGRSVDYSTGSSNFNPQQQQQQQQQQQESTSSSTTIVRGPRTVSSLSSLETTGYEDLNDIGQGLDFNFPNTHAYTHINNQQSIVPSPLLPSLMESRTSSNTLVTTSTTAASAGGDIMEQQQLQQQQQQHQQHHSQELQQHPLAVTSSIASVIPVQSSGIIATGSMQIIPPSTGGVVMASAVTNSNTANANTVPEFLYQLTKMLTDNNRDIIEWSNCKCEE